MNLTKEERRAKFLAEHPEHIERPRVIRFPKMARHGKRTGKWKKWSQLTNQDIDWRRDKKYGKLE